MLFCVKYLILREIFITMRYNSRALTLLICLFFYITMNAGNDKFFGDSCLYTLSMQCYDSIRKPVSLAMSQRGLEEAVKKGNAHFDYVFRVIPLSHYRMIDNEERFTEEAQKLIAYYKQQPDKTDNIYRIWEMLIEYLRLKGNMTGCVVETDQMAEYATRHGHRIGMGIANLLWGASFLDSGQRDEAMQYYDKSYQLFKEVENSGYAFRAALNMMIIYYNKSLHKEALALSDNLPPFIRRWEQEKGNMNPVFRCKLALYRTQNLCALDKQEEAATQLDSMNYYYAVYPDYSLREPVAYTRFLYAKNNRDVKEAERQLRKVIAINEQQGNAPLLVRFYNELAQLGKLKKDQALQLEAYEKFALWTDSADLQTSNRQLNELSSRYRLKEISWEKQQAEDRAAFFRLWVKFIVSICIGLILLLGGYIFYSRRLKQKNKVLSQHIQEQQQLKQKIEECKVATPNVEQDKDVLLFGQLEAMMKEKKLFCNPVLTRKDLSDLLGTNEIYLADSIRKCSEGMTVKEYITMHRLKYVCYLLSTQRELTIDTIGEMAGFNSRSTYFRLFRETYGLTPTEFRKSVM